MSERISFSFINEGFIQEGVYNVDSELLPSAHRLQNVANNLNMVDENGDPVAQAVDAIEAQLIPYPENFLRQWATFQTATDVVDKGYDPGAYGGGGYVYRRTITIPSIKPVTLLRMSYLMGHVRSTTTVTFDGTPAEAIAAGLLGPDNARTDYTAAEYVAKFGRDGYTRSSKLYPAKVGPTFIEELASFRGDFEYFDTNDDLQVIPNIILYVEPMYIANVLPLFDYIYMKGDGSNAFTEDGSRFVRDASEDEFAEVRYDADGNPVVTTGKRTSAGPYRLLRWRGGHVSAHMAPINRAGDAVLTGEEPEIPATIGINGTHYTGAGEYNVINSRFPKW